MTNTKAIDNILNQRWIPEGYYVSQSETPTRVYFKEANGKFYALGFRGRSIKPTFNYVFRTETERQAYVDRFFASILNDSVRKTERQARRKALASQGHSLKVGDILVSSWGYEQTNIDYYQVTELIGKTMVEIRQIKAEVVGNHGFYDRVMPVKDAFCTPRFEGDTYRCLPLRKKVDPGSNSVTIHTYASAYPWDGRADEKTALGYGH